MWALCLYDLIYLIQANSMQLIIECSEANQVLTKPAGHWETDTGSQGKRH